MTVYACTSATGSDAVTLQYSINHFFCLLILSFFDKLPTVVFAILILSIIALLRMDKNNDAACSSKGCHIAKISFLLLGTEQGLKLLHCSALDCMRLKFNNFAYLNTNGWKTSCLLYMCDVCFYVIILTGHGRRERDRCMQGRGCCALSSSLYPILFNPNLIFSFFITEFVVVLPESNT